MRTELIDLAVELAVLLVYAVASLLLTYEGLLSEFSAVGSFVAGNAVLGVWYLFMGALARYAGVVLVGRDLVWRRACDRFA